MNPDLAMPAVIEPLGDCAVIVSWPGVSRDDVAQRIQRMARAIQEHWHHGFECVVPAFASLTLHYSPTQIQWRDVRDFIEAAMAIAVDLECLERPVIEIPTCYDLPFALDLAELAERHGLATTDIIRMHSKAVYTVRMIGFSPGFPYLAGLPDRLITPRKNSPRLKVPAGSVAIGGHQTGIYSIETPGGWNIIGRTPTRLFLPENDPPCLLQAGDRVRFVPITAETFSELQVHV